ncbi:MAG: hypothetical protein ABH845_00020 [Candidatus Omnitrophota bacterium]
MSFKRWLATGILIVLTASFAASTAVLTVLRERELARRILVEESLFQARRTQRQMEQELKSHREKSARLEREFLTQLHLSQSAFVRLKGLEKKMNRLQKEVSQLRTEKLTLASERNRMNGELMAVLSDRKSLKTRLDKVLARTPEEVDLGQIVVSARPTLEGKILVVNDKFQFVVINLGQNADLGAGSLLNVYRGDQFIGRIQVEQIRENVAACKILSEWAVQNIQEEDRVKEL